MNKSKAMKNIFLKAPLALAVSALTVGSVQAVEFNFGDVSVQIDNSVSYGASWRTKKPDSGQIWAANGAALGVHGKSSSNNYDDGTLNYKQWDMISNNIKWSGDLEVKYQNYGAFVRARAWYDQVIMDETPRFKKYNSATKSYAGKGAEIMDAFVYGDWEIAGKPVNLRVGRQVLNWGESTFIQGGIGSINPVDASAFRRPGAEIKEGLLPVNMISTSIGLTDSLTFEAFYQLEWEKTRTDPCGTFFSTIDFVGDGCGPVLLSHSDVETANNMYPLQVVPRMSDDEPKDDGQFGVAFRMYTDLFGGTEFGVYYMNLHSRMPYISGMPTTAATSATDFNQHRLEYQIAYPEDIQVMGVSFAGSLPNGASLSGEISYKPNLPLQWNAFELIFAGVPGAWEYSRFYRQRVQEHGLNPDDPNFDPTSMNGKVIDGFDKFDVWQAQTTYIQTFDHVFGADQLALVAEAGVNYIPDLPSKSDARYGRSGAYGIGNTTGPKNACMGGETFSNENPEYCTDKGYVSEWSGGVRVRAGLTFNNAFAGVNVIPTINLAYDMGYGPEPGAQFIDERFSYGVGTSFVYMNNFTVDVTYAGFEGNKYDQMTDRDNIALAVKYSF